MSALIASLSGRWERCSTSFSQMNSWMRLLFFQFKIISERVQEFLNDNKIIPKKLSLFLKMCRGSFNFLDVSLDISLYEFFNVSSSEIQWNFFSLSSNNKKRDEKIYHFKELTGLFIAFISF